MANRMPPTPVPKIPHYDTARNHLVRTRVERLVRENEERVTVFAAEDEVGRPFRDFDGVDGP